MREENSGLQHIPALDGVRGLAILLVLIHHAFSVKIGGRTGLDEFVGIVTDSFYCGVDLFFVLSGFLITRILFFTKSNPNYFRNFYGRRILRIFPLYYGFLVIFFFVLPKFFHGFNGPGDRWLYAHQFWFWTYLQNWWFMGIWPHETSDFLNHFWSLAVEEQFYVLWPFLIFLLNRTNLKRLCVGIVLLTLLSRCYFWLLGREPMQIFVGTPFRLDGLMLGAYLALVFEDKKDITRLGEIIKFVFPATVLFLIGVIAFQGNLYGYSPAIITVGLTILELLFTCMVFSVIQDDLYLPFLKCFKSDFMSFLGKYSYAIYVFHWPIMRVVGAYYNPDILLQWTNHQVFARTGFFVLTSTLTIVISTLSWYAFESRALRLKRYFTFENTFDRSA